MGFQRTIWCLEHPHQGKRYHWRFEQVNGAHEITVTSWEEGKLIASRQTAIHTIPTARELWNLVTSTGGWLLDTREIK
jgi:hypothetical protein